MTHILSADKYIYPLIEIKVYRGDPYPIGGQIYLSSERGYHSSLKYFIINKIDSKYYISGKGKQCMISNMKTTYYTTQHLFIISNNTLDSMDEEDYGFFCDIENIRHNMPIYYVENKHHSKLTKYRRNWRLTEEDPLQNRRNFIIVNKINFHINLAATTAFIICNTFIIYNLFVFIYSL